jgi:5-methyltetrahydrofolate--homocysteine methyltransferase
MLLMGDVTEEELYNAFREQSVALENGGADAVCIETMSDADETVLAIKAAKENTALEVIATFTFEKTMQGEYRTMMGLSPSDAIRAALDAGADIIGTNCGNGMERMIDIVKEIRSEFPEALILVHANAGIPVLVGGETSYPETPEMMAAYIPELVSAGANIVGGCCGTTPDHIKAMKKTVDELRAI